MTYKTQGHLKSAHAPPPCLVSHNDHCVNYIIPPKSMMSMTYDHQLDYAPKNPGMIAPLAAVPADSL